MESQKLFLRRASVADVDLVAPLFDAYRQFYGQAPDLAAAREFLRERLERDQSVIFIALRPDGTAAGFTQLYPSFSSASAARIFIVNDLFVDPAARRVGVAQKLLQAAADFGRSQGAVRLTLSTAHTNGPAQSLYERAGWQRDQVFCNYNLAL